MPDPIPASSDLASGYECVNCGYRIDLESVQPVPTCPNCNGPRVWEFSSGSEDDPDH